MVSPSVDLLVLTFNCAKALIDVAVFANHLQAAFSQNATTLPDVVVVSLQEAAPMSYAFIGGYLLSPYLERYQEAVNLAAVQFLEASEAGQDETGPRKPYDLVKSKNVGATVLLAFARDPTRLRDVEEAEVGFGAADMGNKGAVGLRATYHGDGGASTELTFVATHLAAMEWNLHRRNANWAAIMRGLTFANPEPILEATRISETVALSPATTAAEDEEDEDQTERTLLLQREHEELHRHVQRQIHDVSVFKPSSHLFVAGDLNYRIAGTSPGPSTAFPSLDPASKHYYTNFLPLDQLTRERKAGRTLHGLVEAPIAFPPTYKYDIGTADTVTATTSTTNNTIATTSSPPSSGEVPWSFAPHRWPSWTDRVLYLDIPPWVRASGSPSATGGGHPKIDVLAYDAMPVVRTSDHRGVFFRALVPLLSPAEMAPPASAAENSTYAADPRARLPIEVDPEAWERRDKARRKEVMAGWSMFLWSTKEGAAILAAVAMVVVGVYWLRTW